MKLTSWLVMLSMAMGISQNLTFDTAPYGRLPQGWVAACTHQGAPPQWQILKDPTAPSQPYVLGQLSTAGPEDRCPLAIYNDTDFRDGEVSVKFKPVAGKEDQAGGLVFRYRDENNYYVVRANALEKNVVLFRVQNGKRVPLAPRGKPAGTYGVKHNVNPNAWSILKVAFKGNSFSVYYDHRRILQADDASLPGAGKVGLWTKADSITYFDNFRVVKKR
jgi:hypothetical protein